MLSGDKTNKKEALGSKNFITGNRYTKICLDKRTGQLDGGHSLDKKRYINTSSNFNFAIISILI